LFAFIAIATLRVKLNLVNAVGIVYALRIFQVRVERAMAKGVQNAGGPPPYRVGEVVPQLGVSNKAALDALKRGRLSGFKLNRMWLIPRDAIDRLGGDGGSQAA
jgi:hypothetical protein